MENMPWVIQWYRDGWDILMKDAKMCRMIRGAADRLWLMKIWCVQWKRRFNRTDDPSFHHIPCIVLKFCNFFTEFCLVNFDFWKWCSCWVLKMLMEEHRMADQCVDLSDTIQWTRWSLLELHSHRGQDMCDARNPESKQQSMEWRHDIITNKEKIQTDHFNSQDHVHSALRQKTRSACGILASRLNNQHRCLLRHT
jgi:hypothetical protein